MPSFKCILSKSLLTKTNKIIQQGPNETINSLLSTYKTAGWVILTLNPHSLLFFIWKFLPWSYICATTWQKVISLLWNSKLPRWFPRSPLVLNVYDFIILCATSMWRWGSTQYQAHDIKLTLNVSLVQLLGKTKQNKTK